MIVIGMIFVAAAIAIRVKDNIENYIASSIIVTTIFAYFLAKVGLAEVGVGLAVAASLMALFYVLFSLFRKREEASIYICTPGLLAFLLLSFIVLVFNIGGDASSGADAYFWVRIAKGMFFFNDLDRAVYTETHPQFIAIWGYLAMKTWRGWSDTVLVVSHSIFRISLLLPMYSFLFSKENKSTGKKGGVAGILLGIILFVLPYISDCDEYATYAPDLAMGFMLGMGSILFVEGIKRNSTLILLNALIFIAAAVVTKRIGIVIVAFLFLWMLHVLLRDRKYNILICYVFVPMLMYWGLFKFDKYPLVVVGALLVAVVTTFIINSKSVKVYIIAGIVVFLVGVAAIIVLASYYISDPRVNSEIVGPLYFKMIFSANEKWYYVGEFIKLPLGAFLLISLAVFLMILKYDKYFFSPEEKVAFCGLNIMVVLYLGMFFHLYNTQITANNALFQDAFLGIPRYFKVITGIILLYWIYIFVSKDKKKQWLLIMVIILLMLTNVELLSRFVFVKNSPKKFTEFEEAGIDLDETSTIAYIGMDPNSPHKQFFLYFFPSTVVDVNELSMTYRITNDMKYITEGELLNSIENCDYIYINDVDDEFSKLYKSLFEDPNNIFDEGSIYYLDEEQKLRLVYNGEN